jgi:hypothetical protein
MLDASYPLVGLLCSTHSWRVVQNRGDLNLNSKLYAILQLYCYYSFNQDELASIFSKENGWLILEDKIYVISDGRETSWFVARKLQ